MTTTEAPYSFNVKAIDQNGFDAMFTIRDEEGRQFFQRVTNLLNWLPANGYTPTAAPRNAAPRSAPATAGQPSPPPAGPVPVCPYHGPMKPSKKHAGFYCPHKLHDGTYCQSKAEGPAPVAQPQPRPQAVAYATQPAPPSNGTPPAMFDYDPPPSDYYYSDDYS